jgi:hypothetical protein
MILPKMRLGSAQENMWPRWLKLREAARYSAIGQKKLIKLAQQGVVSGFQDPDHGRKHWIFDRLTIDSFRESQASQPTAKEEALDIMRTM